MKRARFLAALLVAAVAPACSVEPDAMTDRRIALVIHGGAGSARPEDFSEERRRAVRDDLAEALAAGRKLLEDGGSAVDAVESTIRSLEDSPLFNAGKGAVFTAAGTHELDASIMDGARMQAGAVAGVTVVKNPISAARTVMEQTEHVLLAGPAADDFARSAGLETVDPKYFFTERRWEALQKRIEREEDKAEQHFGTVGAVALDADGRIAAGTSTGGMTYKRHGRVGDSPIVGAGTYANGDCGVSSTGHGEFFIRHAVAFDICARMGYLGVSVLEAATSVVNGTLSEAGGSGGVIALDARGNAALVYNTRNMARAWIDAEGTSRTAIFGRED